MRLKTRDRRREAGDNKRQQTADRRREKGDRRQVPLVVMGENILINTDQWRKFWMAQIFSLKCGVMALKFSGGVLRWR